MNIKQMVTDWLEYKYRDAKVTGEALMHMPEGSYYYERGKLALEMAGIWKILLDAWDADDRPRKPPLFWALMMYSTILWTFIPVVIVYAAIGQLG